MQIDLYRTTSPNNKLYKDLTDKMSFKNCQFISANDRKTPSIRIVSALDLTVYNYAYIDLYSRYYFCDVTNIATGVYLLTCRFDVLSTCASQVANLNCTIKRSANFGSPYMYDELYKTQAYKKYVTKEFPNGCNDNCFILMTVGNKTIL